MPGLAASLCRRWSVLALFLALSGTASAAWLEASNTDFVFITDASEDRAREILRDFAVFKLTLPKLAPASLKPLPVPVSLYAIDARDWGAFKRDSESVSELHFHSDRHYVFFDMTPGLYQARDVMLGAYTYHRLVAATRTELPYWWKSGAAQVFGTIAEYNGRVEFGRYSYSPGMQVWTPRFVPLDTMLRVRTGEDASESSRLTVDFYPQAWLMAHYFLLGNPERGKQLPSYLDLVDAGVPVATAVERAFGVSIPELEKEIEGYGRANQFPVFQVDIGELPNERDVVLKPLSESVANARLALAGRSVGLPEAEIRRFVDRAAKAEPGHPLVLAARANLVAGGGKGAEVRSLVREVLSKPEAQEDARYAAAKAMLRQIVREIGPGSEGLVDTGDFVSIAESLGKFEQLDAEQKLRLAEIRDALAGLPPASGQQPGAALAVAALDTMLANPADSTLSIVQAASKAYPTNTDLADFEARLLVKLGRRDKAVSVLSRAAENAQSGTLRKRYVARMRELE